MTTVIHSPERVKPADLIEVRHVAGGSYFVIAARWASEDSDLAAYTKAGKRRNRPTRVNQTLAFSRSALVGPVCPTTEAAQGVAGRAGRLFPTVGLEGDDLATVLAALRFYQEKGQGDPANRSGAIHDIATAGGDVISLDADAIDALCERLNQPAPIIRVAAPLNRFQAVTAAVYGEDDYSHVTDQAVAKSDQHGDTLFTFLMRELDDDCGDDAAEALRRVRAAISDLEDVESALSRLAS